MVFMGQKVLWDSVDVMEKRQALINININFY